MTIYTVNFTNKSKAPIYVNDGETNTQTSMTMFGQNSTNYGSALWTNLLQYMENYASETPPNNAIEGQFWYNSSAKVLNVNTGKLLGSPIWSPIIPQSEINTTNLLTRNGGTLTYDLQLTDPITEDDQFVTKTYVDANANVKFTSKNDTYQYNIMDFNGFVTINGVIQASQFGTGHTYTVELPRIMNNTSYTVVLTVSSKLSNYTASDEDPSGHHYSVKHKTTTSFTIDLLESVGSSQSLPSNGEIQFCLVGLIKS